MLTCSSTKIYTAQELYGVKLINICKKDPIIVKAEDGSHHWFLNGARHRVDGPAVIHTDGTQEWYINDKRHRVDGPAVIHTDGTQEWYIKGNKKSFSFNSINELYDLHPELLI